MDHVYSLLRAIGEDPDREGLKDTPRRASSFLRHYISGTPDIGWLEKIVGGAIYDAHQGVEVSVTGIPFMSLCEHHLLPFFGTVDVHYLPNLHIIGLSKIPKIVDAMSRRLNLQEGLTNDIAAVLKSVVRPFNITIKITAQHCCIMRHTPGTITITSTTLLGR